MRISPAVGSINLRIVLPAVDLPQPLSPTSPKVSPSAMSKEMPSTACTCPTARCNSPFLTGKCLTRPLTDSSGPPPIPSPAPSLTLPRNAGEGRVGASGGGAGNWPGMLAVTRGPPGRNGNRRRNARAPSPRKPGSRGGTDRSRRRSAPRTGSPGSPPSATAPSRGSRRAAARARLASVAPSRGTEPRSPLV